ncbi:VRR-NUC domain-containing protein [Listeria monocytogenes]|uniref:VRR-NUC domain protein n=2 Tax=root TaxID=1 RepID=W0G8N0_9CAUD|nr:VRR-NUC domain-containing protein [Listeria monocytogenes]YP_008997817.1 Holliday junction resolvase [Listeria phage LP-030-2]AHF53418.1 VRR-NUC domain protein [Listeria phage LP-030-2]AXO75350.1 VRR-NUC domain-containing protein [Listeria monocytogenes]EAA0055275.1 VRR-NUC domain-containing protein [Listeria monocytogenes]EAA0076109.1 VRR-NUC domain-containing protein [Listeria monocytogenes]EAA0385163.1 VRR-NUC domain-containing protein [Listeria monocytogenes]
MTAEIDIQNSIRLELSRHGHYVFRANVGKVRMPNGRIFDTGLPKGFPDLFGFRGTDGKMFFIEVKNEIGKLRQEQKNFQQAMEITPAICGVARSVEEALRIVEGLK